MMDYYDALERLLAELAPQEGCERLPLAAAQGRVLARPLAACYDSPQFDNSAMDGYALCDPAGAVVRFAVVGRTAAGDAPAPALEPGQALRIFTGAPLPAGASAVVAQEDATLDGDTLTLSAPLPAGRNIRVRGEETRAGDALLAAGTLLDPAALALAASQGHAQLDVLRRLRVAVFSSGDELLEPGAALTPGKIYDANRYQLLGWLATLPVDVVDGGILPDDAAVTRQRLEQAAAGCDVILTSGGVSVGEEDHVKAALSAIGRIDAWRLAIKPGKPFAWGQAGRARVFMLPGNPVATFATFLLLVAPAIRRLAGLADARPLALSARAAFAKPRLEPRREFLRAVATPGADGVLEVRALQGQGSAMLSACVAANVLVEVPPSAAVAEGDALRVYPLPGKGLDVGNRE